MQLSLKHPSLQIESSEHHASPPPQCIIDAMDRWCLVTSGNCYLVKSIISASPSSIPWLVLGQQRSTELPRSIPQYNPLALSSASKNLKTVLVG